MRRQGPLKVTSTQDLCIFCTCRLIPNATSTASNRTIPTQRRHISSTNRASQLSDLLGKPATTSEDTAIRRQPKYGALYSNSEEPRKPPPRPPPMRLVQLKADKGPIRKQSPPTAPFYNIIKQDTTAPQESKQELSNAQLGQRSLRDWTKPSRLSSALPNSKIDAPVQKDYRLPADSLPSAQATQDRHSWTRNEPVTRPFESVTSKNRRGYGLSQAWARGTSDMKQDLPPSDTQYDAFGPIGEDKHGRRTVHRPSHLQEPKFQVHFDQNNAWKQPPQRSALDGPSKWPLLRRAKAEEHDFQQDPSQGSIQPKRQLREPFSQLNPEEIAKAGYLPFNQSVVPVCNYCKQEGHYIRDCPVKPANRSSQVRDVRESNSFSIRKTQSERGEERSAPEPRLWRPVADATAIAPSSVETTNTSELSLWRDNAKSDRRHLEVPKHEDPRRGRKARPSRYRDEDDENDSRVQKRGTRGRRNEDEDEDYEDDYRAPRKGGRRRRDEDEDDERMKPSREEKVREAERKRLVARKRLAKRANRVRHIHLPEFISVNNLSTELGLRPEEFMRKLEELGFENLSNDFVLNAETAGLIAQEYDYEPIFGTGEGESKDIVAQPVPEDLSTLPPRPPVVTIMGHVDHGKTTILDYIRKSSVAATEHGGITQHIGAFSVPLSGGKTITFLDTPGHAAFLAMRQRGANVTDIVILVVAADDSVMPQTIEAIKHARAANVPMIVALNKIDKEDARPEKVKQDLARHGVEVEDFGGETQVVAVSGKTGQGMDELEEAVVALSELLDHRATPEGNVEGWVLEATMKKTGKVATVLVRRGTLKLGDIVVAGTAFARVRSLRNEAGVLIPEAGPGVPVEVDGWRGQPGAGDELLEAPNEQKAAAVVEYREAQASRIGLAKDMEAINENRKLEQERREREEALAKAKEEGKEPDELEALANTSKETESGLKEIYFIIKADVAGSVEAVVNAISHLGNNEVRPHILRSGVGGVNESDITHALAAKGHIIAFNTTLDPRMAVQAEKQNVKIVDQSIIYRLVEDVSAILEESLPPLITQRVTGEAEIAQEFLITVKGRQTIPIAGCKVRNGVISRNEKIRVLREGEVVFDGSLHSLKMAKKDVTEMRKGTECGMGFEGWTEFQVGDQVQCYVEKSEKRRL